VSVPHTWNRVGYYIPNPQMHINRADTIDKYQGVGWYRLTFTPASTFGKRRAWLQFDAASRTAEVWLNGKRIGEHRGGFSRFRLDATDALRPGQPNTLLVKVDNTQPDAGTSTADVLPLAGDFFVHGGLYRPVSLIGTDAVHVDMLDSGGSGILASTRAITADAAQVNVRVRRLAQSDGQCGRAARRRWRQNGRQRDAARTADSERIGRNSTDAQRRAAAFMEWRR
jgi:beta-galactosidase